MSTHRLAAVLGKPTAHSLSPIIHNYWFRKHGISGAYIPMDVEDIDLKNLFEIAPKIGFSGFNITAPLKEAAYKLCTRVSETASRAQSVNLVVFSNGDVIGDSTDGYGFLENLQEETGFVSEGQTACIIGAGGAARAIVEGLIARGAKEVRISNRTPARAEAIAATFDGRVRVVEGWPASERFYDGASLIVHATTYGMHGELEGARPWRFPQLDKHVIAADLIYVPLKTVFLEDAEGAGARLVDGLGMLLHQARPCFDAWFDCPVQVDAGLRNEVIRVLNARNSKA
ncbi:MAG: shikimate dehydrogenase [Neomegalonema sp.]|nr:shikimate dehydrogenase [Neomegalonema sp.]